MTATVERRKVQFRNPEGKGFRWKYEDELTPRERELADEWRARKLAKQELQITAPSPQAAPAAPSFRGSRFGRQAQTFTERADRLEAQANNSGDSVRYGRLMNDAAQFRKAAEMLEWAELVEPGSDVSFGYAPNYGMFTRLPPAISGSEIYEPIRIYAHTYRTSDPIKIAWLRMLIAENANDNLIEMTPEWAEEQIGYPISPHALDAAVSPDGRTVTWLPRKAVEELRRSGAAKVVRTA